MRLKSLQARMLALSAVATLVALALAGWAVGGVLEGFVTQGVDRRLDAQLTVLASVVDGTGAVDRDRLEARLGVLDAGRGWRWQIATPRATLASQDFPALEPGPPPPGPPGPIERGMRPEPLDGRDHTGRVHARSATITTTGGAVRLTAAAPLSEMERPIQAALVPLLAVLAALAVILAMAAIVQWRLALLPLRQLRAQVAAIRSGASDRIAGTLPSELQPLADELNALASENTAALQHARASAANLAHALKTPVATLALSFGEDAPAMQQVARIQGVIRHHLARARAVAVGRRATTMAAPAIADIVATVRKLHPAITIDAEIPTVLALAVDGHDLAEIIGNLIDNAARFARSTVEVSAVLERTLAQIRVSDDGPGIAAEIRARVAEPGVRLDQSGSGDGFGLAIVRDLVTLYGGVLTLAANDDGGLTAAVTLPLSDRCEARYEGE